MSTQLSVLPRLETWMDRVQDQLNRETPSSAELFVAEVTASLLVIAVLMAVLLVIVIVRTPCAF